MTLHAALCLNTKKSNKSNSKSHRDLIAMWKGVDYLFIDKVSMISCNFLCRISEALSIVKGNTTAFGGVNIIFTGDFTQLPPIKETHHSSSADCVSQTTVAYCIHNHHSSLC